MFSCSTFAPNHWSPQEKAWPYGGGYAHILSARACSMRDVQAIEAALALCCVLLVNRRAPCGTKGRLSEPPKSRRRYLRGYSNLGDGPRASNRGHCLEAASTIQCHKLLIFNDIAAENDKRS